MKRSYARKFPGRAAVLEAVRAVGEWTPRDVSKFARENGGSELTYAALAWLVRKGRLTYEPNRWTAAAPTFDHAATQRRARC